jgi:integrase
MDMGKVEEWLSAVPSKYTKKTYKAGIRKFEEFYQQGIETLIGKSPEETGHVIDRFYVWLQEKGHGQNTRRNVVNSAIQFLKFFGTEPKYKKSLHIYQTVATTRDHRTSIGEIQEMAKTANLREQVLLEVFLMGLRIGDVALLEWSTFDVQGDCPIPILINTKKEQVVARSFISAEFKAILGKYFNTLDKSSKFLFQSKRSGHLTVHGIQKIFKGLQKRAGVVNHGLFRWHTGRKLFLRTCAELGISSWSAKLMVGKSIPASDDTYVHDAELRKDFIKVSNVLKLFPVAPSAQSDVQKTLDTVMEVLRALMEDACKQKGLLKKTKTVDWLELHERLKPESERKEHVQID